MSLPPDLIATLRLPIIAAPMFLVSGPDLVIASCQAGIIGSFPTANCRTLEDLDCWLTRIVAETQGAAIVERASCSSQAGCFLSELSTFRRWVGLEGTGHHGRDNSSTAW